jgi:tRNA A-37 threonylcarbamoyl transferase component Bud32
MSSTPHEPSSREQRVNEAIAAYLEAVERGENPDREKFLAENPDLAVELNSFFTDRECFEQAAGKPEQKPTPVANEATLAFQGRGVPSPHDVIRYFGDYELLEEIARGGMGVVFKARQVKLNRIVAVKMILAGSFAGPEDVERFHTEAEAAAQLDHPGIVPIYEVGQHDGQHYFSMGFVEGQSLAKKVAEGPLPPKEAAEIVKAVAEAVQYAHDKGIIHRDLKPGNILLDRDGNPRVTDFGLAKLTESGSDLTGTGQILGTPSYMPPEQAAAQVSAVGRLSDVYSLGAVLYCLLTGRPPFQAASPLETLLQVQKQDPVPPKQLNPNIPLDLDTIVLKCLDKTPVRRFMSAQALAEELQRYLNGRPILARPVGRVERFWRWCQREPAVAGLSAAVGVALVAGTILSTYYGIEASNRAKEKIEHADALRELERVQTEQIENSFTTALDTIEDMCSPLASGDMNNLGVYRPFADRIERFTNLYLKKFEKTDSMAVHTGRVYELRAIISRVLTSDTSQALRHYQRAEEIYWSLKPSDKTDATALTRRLANVHLSLGRLHILPQEYRAAEDMLGQARESFEKLCVEQPDDRGLKRDLAEVYHSLGEVFLERDADGRMRFQALRDSQENFEESRKLREKLMESSRGSERNNYELDLARTLGYLGDLCLAQGNLAAATDNYNRSREHRQELYNSNPTDPEYRFQLARLLGNFGYLERDYRGHLDVALEHFQAARAFQARLAEDFPEVGRFHRDLGGTLNSLAEVWLLEAARDPEKAAPYGKLAGDAANQAIGIFSEINRHNPTDADGVHGLALSYVLLAALDQLNGASETVRHSRNAEQVLLSSPGGEPMLGRVPLVTPAMCRSLQNQPEAAWSTLKAAVDRGENTVNRFERHRKAGFRSIGEHPQLGPQFDELCRTLRTSLGLPRDDSLRAAR